jgi:hypothetical protein
LRARFYIDPATESPHICNHQVTEDEVVDVLDRPGEDRAGREGSRIALGQKASGRYLRVVYVPDPEPDSVFVINGVGIDREATCGVSKAQEEEAPMNQPKFPERWSEDKVRRVLAHYEKQTEDEAVAEDEAGIESSDTVMNIPHDLVPRVRELIAKHQR